LNQQHPYICSTARVRLPDVLERQGLSLSLLSKLIVSLILDKHFVVLEYFLASLKVVNEVSITHCYSAMLV